MDSSFEFADRQSDRAKIDLVFLLDKSGQEALVADGIDQPGDALAVAIDPPQGRQSEVWDAFSAGYLQAMLNVLADFQAIERFQVITDRDPLTQLPKPVIVQPIPQLGLTQQNDLEKLAFVGFEVG